MQPRHPVERGSVAGIGVDMQSSRARNSATLVAWKAISDSPLTDDTSQK
jgi:hypothetical protein